MQNTLRKRLGVKALKDLVAFENENYLVVSKPPHISTLADRHDPYNMLDLFRGVSPAIQACHRLDKETSGALVLSKHPDAYRHLAIQFEHRTVEKTYHAIVNGIHELDEKVDLPLMYVDSGKVLINPAGKHASTVFKSVRAFKGHTLVECKPETGRKHQIRVHLAYLGANIVGDIQYGGKHIYLSAIKKRYNLKKGTEELPLSRRFLLHALSISFQDLDGKIIASEVPYPKDFRVVLKQLEQNQY